MIPPSPIPPLLIALFCDAIIGDPDWLYRRVPHPVVWMGRAIGAFDRAWNRPEMDEVDRLVRGGVAVCVVVGCSAGVGIGIEILLQSVPDGWIVNGILMSVLIAQRSLYLHVRDVGTALTRGGLQAGRDAVGRIVGRKTAALDESGVSRGAIESLAENFSDGVVAPIFWAALLGLPGILAFKALNTADSMIGHRSEKYLHFGRVAARLDDVANYIPARIAGLMLILAAMVKPGASAGGGIRTMMSDARHHRSVNAGYPEAAMAGVLGIRLSGPREYNGVSVEEAWIGHGSDAAPNDIMAALGIFVRACAVLFILVLLAAIIGQAWA